MKKEPSPGREVFISYARADSRRVLPWVRRLEKAGVSCWVDTSGIPVGSDWMENIAQAIRASKAFLLFVSDSSTRSSHVKRELNAAITFDRPVFPLFLESVALPGGWVYAIGSNQNILLTDKEEEKVLEEILGTLTSLGVHAQSGHSETLVPRRETAQKSRLQVFLNRFKKPENVPSMPGGQTYEATVLIFDLWGTTVFAETDEPSSVFAELSEIFKQIGPRIEVYGGAIYSMMGDGFLALFGGPVPLEKQAQAAVDAALDIRQVMRRINSERMHTGRSLWRAGIGIHTGSVVSGYLGAGTKREISVMGDAVNLAARLEELNKVNQSEITISEETWNRLDTKPEAVGPVQFSVRGRSEPVSAYYLPVESE